MDIRQLREILNQHTDEEMEVAVRVDGDVYSIASAEVVHVEGEPFFLALDCEDNPPDEEVGDEEDDEADEEEGEDPV